MHPMRSKKLDNQTHNDLHMSHVNVIFLIFKKLSEKSLRADVIKALKWLLFLQFQF